MKKRSEEENNFDALILTLPDHSVFAVNEESASLKLALRYNETHIWS